MRVGVVGLQIFGTAVLLGIGLPRLPYLVNIIILLVFLSFVFMVRHRNITILLLCIFGLFIGTTRGFTVWNQLSQYPKLFEEKVELTGKVVDDAIYGFRLQTEFYVEDVLIDNRLRLPGKVRVSGFGQIEVKRLDQVWVNGELRRGYGSYQASIGFAKYQVLSRSDSPIEKFRHGFIASSYSVLPEPHASLGLGFLAGFRALLPDDLTENLSITGLTHIVAVSGYNTTIIASAVQRLLAKKISRWQVVVWTLALLVCFIAITGSAPSVVRAATVSIMSLIAWYYGRRFKPSVILLLSAALTAWITPINLWYSLGWWLSFTAFIGVLMLAPALTRRYFKKKSPSILTKTVIETTSAQLMTLPLIIWVFGKVSVIALLANLLVLPIIPIAMLTTFIGGVVSMFSLDIAGVLIWPAKLVLSYIVDIIALLASLPWSLADLTATKTQMFGIYSMIVGLMGVIYRKVARNRQQIVTVQ